jgi:hypothetical protein
LSPADLIAAGERLYGPHWRQPLAWALQVNIATLRRWTSGEIEVPGPAALAIRLLLERAHFRFGQRMRGSTCQKSRKHMAAAATEPPLDF